MRVHTAIPQYLRTSLYTLLAACIAASGLLFAPLPAHAAGGIPFAVFDPYSVAWASVRNMSSSAYGDYFTQKKNDGYMVIDIEVTEIDGDQRVGAVFQKNLDGRGWYQWRNLSDTAFSQKWQQYKNDGYRLVDQESYVLNGTRYYAGIWIENRENLPWASWRNLSDTEFSSKFQEYKNAGYMPVDIEGYPTDSGLRYAVIWVKNVDGIKWAEWRDLSSEAYGAKFDEYDSDYRVLDVESYHDNGKQYYAGIWIENTDGRGWYQWRDMTSTAFGDKWLQLRDAGYRLTDYDVYPTSSGWRYAGVWRQNGIRPDWHLKDAVDTYLDDQVNQHDIPGLSVAVAHRGQFVYLRGFGYADVADEKIATAHTVYRLASVSKAVGGVLTVRLAQQGVVDLNAPTADYIATLPAHHTHTLSQTASNRSGIGHYEEHGDVDAQYDTALAAAQFFWDDPLVYTPGADTKYSTHAYTVLGAALEGATDAAIGEIVDDILSEPFGLSSLQVENPNESNPDRATLYNNDNSEASRDNTTWKVLGGGLEGSAYDLAHMGIQILNGQILSATSRDTLWTPPDDLSSYALGWDTDTESGTSVVYKNGRWRGANTYIRIYPEKHIVIVVLSNRREGGHSADDMGQEIGRMMLGAEARTPDRFLIKPLPIGALPFLLQGATEEQKLERLVVDPTLEPVHEIVELLDVKASYGQPK
jgi:CubicO group peptidase (beta-lactamase class C family)